MQCSCVRLLLFFPFYYPVFEFYIYVNWERIESKVLYPYEYICSNLLELCIFCGCSALLSPFIPCPFYLLFISAFRQRDHVQLYLTMRINCTLDIIFLCTLLHSLRFCAKKEWIAISSIGHKCSSKNKQQVFKQSPQFHVLVTLFTASSMAFQNKSRNEFIEWTEQFIYLFDLCFECFFFAFLRFAQKMFPITLLLYLQLLWIFISDARQFALLKGIWLL